MKVYYGDGLGDMYHDLLRDLVQHGYKTHPRGHTCLTLGEPITLIYDRPGFCLMDIPGRKLNIFFALMESLWILAGSGDVDWICFFNENMRQFSDFGYGDFHGSYGLRMRHWSTGKRRIPWDNERLIISEVDQIQYAVNKIIGDPDTRQAVISLWDPTRDNIDVSRDFPCNNVVYLSQRDGRLHLTVVIRSNDLIWGTPHNAIQFTHLLALLAGMTNLSMGRITYVVNNLHVYIDGLYQETYELLKERALSSQVSCQDNPGSKCIPSFVAVSDGLIKHLFYDIVTIVRGVPADICGHEDSYWLGTLPKMAKIFWEIKHGINSEEEQIPDLLASKILALPSPLPSLIVDFYKDSKNPYARKVATECQKRLDSQ